MVELEARFARIRAAVISKMTEYGVMKRLIPFIIGCCALVAQNQQKEQKLDPTVLVGAPVVPQMVVDSDGTLHFGPRTVQPPALESPDARRSYTRQMMQRAQTSAGRGGLASVRIVDGHPAPDAAGRSKE